MRAFLVTILRFIGIGTRPRRAISYENDGTGRLVASKSCTFNKGLGAACAVINGQFDSDDERAGQIALPRV